MTQAQIHLQQLRVLTFPQHVFGSGQNRPISEYNRSSWAHRTLHSRIHKLGSRSALPH